MFRWRGLPKVKRGTPPTPADPSGSNVLVLEYRDRSCDAFLGWTSARILREAEAAVVMYPDSAPIRSNFAFELLRNGLQNEAIEQMKGAVEMDSADSLLRSQYALLLKLADCPAESEEQKREAFKLQVEGERHPGTYSAHMAKWCLVRPVDIGGRPVDPDQPLEETPP